MSIINKWKKIPDSVKSALVFGFCSFFSSGISFLLTSLFTRIMTKEQYGIVTEYNSWHYILEVFAVLGLASVGSFNVGLNEYRKRRENYISNMLVLVNISTIAVFGVIFIIRWILEIDIILPDRLLIFMFIGFMFSPAMTFYLARKRYEYSYLKGALVTLGSVIAIQGLSIVFVLLTETETEEASMKVLGALVGTLVFAIPLYVLLLAKGGLKQDFKMWKSMVIFTLPLLPHYLAMHVMNGADRIMVSRLISQEAAAVYGVASALGTAASTAWIAINGSLQPFIFNNLNAGNTEKIRRVTKVLVVLFAGICFLISLFAPEILSILAPQGYSEAIYALPPIIGMSFLNALYNIYASIEFYHKKSVGIAVATVIASVLNILLNAWLIPIYGLVAAGYTSLISNAALTFFHYIGYTRCRKERVFSDLYNLCVTCLCIGACICCRFMYEMLIPRILVMLMIAIVIVLKRKNIQKIFKEYL